MSGLTSKPIYSSTIKNVLDRLNEKIEKSVEVRVFSHHIILHHEPGDPGITATLSVWWTRYPPHPQKIQPKHPFYVKRYAFMNNSKGDVVDQAKEAIPDMEKDFIWDVVMLGLITMYRNHEEREKILRQSLKEEEEADEDRN